MFDGTYFGKCAQDHNGETVLPVIMRIYLEDFIYLGKMRLLSIRVMDENPTTRTTSFSTRYCEAAASLYVFKRRQGIWKPAIALCFRKSHRGALFHDTTHLLDRLVMPSVINRNMRYLARNCRDADSTSDLNTNQ